jgi:hypothetical protein
MRRIKTLQSTTDRIHDGVLVNTVVTVMNIVKILCGAFGLHPSFVTGILNSVNDISFYVLCSEN